MAVSLASGIIEADRESLIALKDLTDFVAVNPANTIEALVALEDHLTRAVEATLRARKQLAASRDAEVAAARAFHNGMLGAKVAVVAQYGNDSPAVQAIGLKKKSERKRPVRRTFRKKVSTETA